MNKKLFTLIIVFPLFWVLGCETVSSLLLPTLFLDQPAAPVSSSQQQNAVVSSNPSSAATSRETQQSDVNVNQFPLVNAWLASRVITDEERNYYGADLSQFPLNVRSWIINSAFTRERMEGVSMRDSALRVWWGDDNHSVHTEASYTIAPGYVNAGSRRTWGQEARYRGSPAIFNTYGEYARFQTLKFKWELSQEVERLLRNDIMFAEVIEFAMQLCIEIEYDWASFSGYTGRVIRTPGQRYAVCDGYTDEVMNKALSLNSVQAVQKWVGPNHSWNVLKLTDGRTLYFDLTWFDNEHIDQETGRIYQTDDYGWENITFNEELFRYSNVGYGSRVFTHAQGRFDREVTKR